MSEPTTRAGKHLLSLHEACDPGDKDCTVLGDLGDITAIEAEARKQERERLAARVEVMPPCLIHSTADDAWPDPHLHRAAVLSILRGEDS